MDFEENPVAGGQVIRDGDLLRLFPGDHEYRYKVTSYRLGVITRTSNE